MLVLSLITHTLDIKNSIEGGSFEYEYLLDSICYTLIFQNHLYHIIGWRVNLDVILEAFQTHIRHFPNEDFSESAQYSGPTIFIGGANSEYIPVSDHPSILEKFPKATFEYIEDAGHWVHSQKPNEFLEVLLKFLR